MDVPPLCHFRPQDNSLHSKQVISLVQNVQGQTDEGAKRPVTPTLPLIFNQPKQRHQNGAKIRQNADMCKWQKSKW